jgi:hypothetical protein
MDVEMQKIIDAQRPMLDAEEAAVKRLGDQIGYGRLMQAAEKVWREINAACGMHGGEHTTGPCAAMMVPCPCRNPMAEERHPEWFTGGHCDWCCGALRVTERVSKAMTNSD